MRKRAHQKSLRRGITIRGAAFILLLPMGIFGGSTSGQVWETAANNQGDPEYVQVPYEVVFVATENIYEGTCTDKDGIDRPIGRNKFGTDVLTATTPKKGNMLMVVTRNGAVKKLFPLPVHETQMVTNPETNLQVRLIDTPLGMLDNGSVVEPNVSEDGERITFAYSHDAEDTDSEDRPKKGIDLFTLDLKTMIEAENPDLIDPSTLPVQRLTFKEYDQNDDQEDSDKVKNAMNPQAAAYDDYKYNRWGTVHLHGVEMRTRDGLKMVYASSDRRLLNSNDQRRSGNYNLNLKIADIEPDGSLGAKRQFQYYTTTAAMSPTPLRNGIAFSYQSSTADGRNWQIQGSDSEGRWSPLIGYGSNQDLFHLGAFCVDTRGNEPIDYFVATKYYNQNNNGFGALWRVNMADVGINTYDDTSASWGIQPRQKDAVKISQNVTDGDAPSEKNGAGEFWGKLTTPRCGRPNELFFAYTPTSANGKSSECESDGRSIYQSHIGHVPNLDPFDPTTQIETLVLDSSKDFSALWPVPVVDWYDRTGEVQQQVANRIIAPNIGIQPGRPYAHVGTSAIYNTDRLPYDYWIRNNGCELLPLRPDEFAYNPNTANNNHDDQVLWNFDALTIVQNRADFKEALAPESVLGIAVNITSNRIDPTNRDYETDSKDTLETVRLLGVHDVREQADQSFKALIPAHVPFEFQLLDKNYGLRLVDVRSWHSLYPRESRTNCGGCHQHEEGKAIPFAGTVAASQPPTDMVTQTQKVDYDAACNPILVTTTNATEMSPEWKADIWPQFDQYCGACHNNTISTDTTALLALTYANEAEAYAELENKHYADNISGALGSPAMWAARGQRMDGRDPAFYEPGGPCDTSPAYKYSLIHDTAPDLCSQNDLTKAQWVYRFGLWIDNHMVRNINPTGVNFPAKHDRFHPTEDIAVLDRFCQGKRLRVGYWDDSGTLKDIEVLVNGVQIDHKANIPNGAHKILNLSLANDDRVKVIAIDPSDNRQIYEKRVSQLKNECTPTPLQAPPTQTP